MKEATMRPRFVVLLFLLMIPSVVWAQAKGGSPYIGYTYRSVLPNKTLPNGVKSMGGGLIGDINADPVYEIANVEKDRTKMLWLNVSTGQDTTGVTGWKVLDVLSFPNLAKSEYLYTYGDPGINCSKASNEIPNLVGVGLIIRKQGIFRPSKLWTANLATKKFEPLPIAGVKCEYSEP
jgi:hypothetical protein